MRVRPETSQPIRSSLSFRFRQLPVSCQVRSFPIRYRTVLQVAVVTLLFVLHLRCVWRCTPGVSNSPEADLEAYSVSTLVRNSRTGRYSFQYSTRQRHEIHTCKPNMYNLRYAVQYILYGTVSGTLRVTADSIKFRRGHCKHVHAHPNLPEPRACIQDSTIRRPAQFGARGKSSLVRSSCASMNRLAHVDPCN